MVPPARSGFLPAGAETMPVLPFSAVRDGSYYEFWVYILASRTGTFYTGVTGYLADRIKQHKLDSIEGFTKKYKVHRLVYYESYQYVMTAIRREKQIKGWRREKKIALIEKMNPRWMDLAENWGREMRFRGQSLNETPSVRWRFGGSPFKRTP